MRLTARTVPGPERLQLHQGFRPVEVKLISHEPESLWVSPKAGPGGARRLSGQPACAQARPSTLPREPAGVQARLPDPSRRRVAGHSEFFNEDFVAALNVLDALMASPLDFAFLLDALGGLALEHIEKIVLARLRDNG